MSKKGEMAYALLKLVITRDVLHLPTPNNFRRELGNIAQQVDIRKDELIEFTKEICNEIFKAWTDAVFKQQVMPEKEE